LMATSCPSKFAFSFKWKMNEILILY
jgi:hypothetical protein